jgi:hypothetical protein
VYALLLLSAAVLAPAQPVPAPSGTFVGPLQKPSPTITQADEEDLVYEDQSLKPLNLDMSEVSDGAELKVRAAKLKFKVPI